MPDEVPTHGEANEGKGDGDQTAPPSRLDRRGIMIGAAAAGAGLAAGLVGGSEPAGAATPSVKLGVVNKEKTTTTIKNSAGEALAASTGSTAGGVAALSGEVTSTSPGSSSTGVQGTNNGTGALGIGVTGTQNGSGWGVYGSTPSGIGVYGNSSGGTGVQGGSGSGTGVYGSSSDGIGVDGFSGDNTGVQGTSNSGYGVYGSSPTNYGVAGVTTSGNGVYGQVGTAPQAGVVGRQTDTSGNWALFGFGNIGASGTKSAVVPVNNGSEHVTLYCVESPECWFEDFGSGQLSGGTAAVAIDPLFAQTIETEGYFVFLQAEGQCKGLFVSQKTPTEFVVEELHEGTSSAPFAYRLVGRRKDVTAPRLNPVTLPDVQEIA